MKCRNKRFLFKIAVIVLAFILLFNLRIMEPFSRCMGNSKKHNKVSIPILMYHSISDNKNSIFTVQKDKFKSQMEYIKKYGYNTLTFDQLNYYISNNKPFPHKSVVITFDDGYEDNYKNAYPVLKEYGLNATLFVITDYIRENSYYLASKQLKEMKNNGIDIQCHTLKHDKLSKLSYNKQLQTLSLSKAHLEKILGSKVKYLAYPFGKYNKDTIKVVKHCGYEMAVTTRMGYFKKGDDVLKMRRICIPGYMSLNIFKKIL